MAYKCDILLGRITKISGYEGAVAVRLEKIFTENTPQMESVFLEIEGRQVPFFISESEYSGADILKLTFDGYDSIDKIGEFTGSKVFAFHGDIGTKLNGGIFIGPCTPWCCFTGTKTQVCKTIRHQSTPYGSAFHGRAAITNSYGCSFDILTTKNMKKRIRRSSFSNKLLGSP